MVTDGDVGQFESDRDFQLGVLAFKSQLSSTPQDTCFRVAASEVRQGDVSQVYVCKYNDGLCRCTLTISSVA